MTGKKAVLIGCGSAAGLVLLLVVAFVAWVAHISKDVEGVSVAADVPLDVVVGETFELVVNVRNERERQPLALSDIDIGEEYLVGFAVISTEPTPESSMHIPLDNSRSFTFGVSIPAGEAKAFTFKLRAEKAGIYRGDVDICEGSRFITTMAQTVVKDKQ